MTKGSISKQMGTEVSRLIGIAQRIKAQERPTKAVEENQEKQDDLALLPMRYKLLKRQYEAALDRESQTRKKYVETRNYKLANFSIEDIEKELVRRLDPGKK